MPITRADVQHVARLARLGLDEEEIDRLAAELDHILDAMQALSQLDTSAIPPTAQVFALRDVVRADTPRPPFPQAVMLANAPAAADGCFKVPAVLDTEG
jgi:aspartyl-tRNA(Asn)/glutamyl-tRNA(Gln) amidotransferase subunit C